MAGSRKPPQPPELQPLGAPERYPFDTYIRLLVRWGWTVRDIVTEVSALGLIGLYDYEIERMELTAHCEQLIAHYHAAELPKFAELLEDEKKAARSKSKADPKAKKPKPKRTPPEVDFLGDRRSRLEYLDFCKARSLEIDLANPRSQRLNAGRQLCLSGPVRDYMEVALLQSTIDYKGIVEGLKRVVNSHSGVTQRMVRDWNALFWNFQLMGVEFKRTYIIRSGGEVARIRAKNPEAALALEFGFSMSLPDSVRVQHLMAVAWENAMKEGHGLRPGAGDFTLWAATHSKLIDHYKQLDPSQGQEHDERYVFESPDTPLLLNVDHLQALEESTAKILALPSQKPEPGGRKKARKVNGGKEGDVDGEHEGQATDRVGAEVVPFRQRQ